MEASHGKGPSMMLPWPVLSSLTISIILSTIMVIKCLMPVSNAGVHLRQGSSQGKPQADLVCDQGSGWDAGQKDAGQEYSPPTLPGSPSLQECDSPGQNQMIEEVTDKDSKKYVQTIPTIPPKANMALYWSKVWLKMQRKGITPATKNLVMVIKMNMKVTEVEDKDRKEEETFSWFVAWQALRRMTYHAASQELIDKMVLLSKTVFVPSFHMYFSKLNLIFQDTVTIFL